VNTDLHLDILYGYTLIPDDKTGLLHEIITEHNKVTEHNLVAYPELGDESDGIGDS
jgi:hypothetical protein